MADLCSRLEIFRELLMCAGNLYFWQYSNELKLEYTNCPNGNFWNDIFSTDPICGYLTHHCANSTMPILLNNYMDLLWIALPYKKNDVVIHIFLIGPVFSSNYYQHQLIQKIRMNHPTSKARDLIDYSETIPVIDVPSFLQYGVMLFYCVTEERIRPTGIVLQIPPSSQNINTSENYASRNRQSGWDIEKLILQTVEDGNINYNSLQIENMHFSRHGNLCPGDPLREVKDENIIFVAICVRAAIRGGYPAESAYMLHDYYVRAIEAANTISDVHACGRKMFDDFVHRVYSLKAKPTYSKIVVRCIAFIDIHILDKFSLSEMAKALGYTEYYLTFLFKEETGSNMIDYINQKKVEFARQQLCSTELGIAKISEQLHFSTPSYFTSVFKKLTGMTPKEYRNSDRQLQ